MEMKTDPDWLKEVLREDIEKMIINKLGPQWGIVLSFLSITTVPDNDIIGFTVEEEKYVRIIIESKAALENYGNCKDLDIEAGITPEKKESWGPENLIRVRILRAVYIALKGAVDLTKDDIPWRIYQITVDKKGNLIPGTARG